MDQGEEWMGDAIGRRKRPDLDGSRSGRHACFS